MNIWGILGIEKTKDKKVIKKAYHRKLKITNPEDDQKGFIQLREAYEQAVYEAESIVKKEEAYLLNMETDIDGEYPSDIEIDTDEEYPLEIDTDINEYDPLPIETDFNIRMDEGRNVFFSSEEKEQKREILEWTNRVSEVCNNVKKRWDRQCWYLLLYEDIPFQMKYYKECRSFLKSYLFSDIYLTQEVWQLIDDFFSFSGTDAERVRGEDEQLSTINKQVKLNEIFDFTKFVMKENMEEIDHFCIDYQRLFWLLCEDYKKNTELQENIADLFQGLQAYQICYLPFECIRLAYTFHDFSSEGIKAEIDKLENQFGNVFEIRLLKVEYLLYGKKKKAAAEQCKILYQELPVKNYVMVYQLAQCCEKTALWHEAMMLYHMLTRLNPKSSIFTKERKCKKKAESQKMKNSQAKPYEVLENKELEAVCALEEQAKALFEEKKYKETIEKCNEILEEYPLSYPVLLLRSYADWNCFGYEKRYVDLNFLIKVNPKGVEARMLSAYIYYASKEYECALDVLKPIKKLCWVQTEYIEIQMIKKKDFQEYNQRMLAFFEKAMVQELPIEAESKHTIFDLKIMFDDAMQEIFVYARTWQEIQELLEFCKRLKSSKHNYPEKYVNMYSVYTLTKMYKEAIKICDDAIKVETDADMLKAHKIRKFVVCQSAMYYSEALELLTDIEDSIHTSSMINAMAEVFAWNMELEKAERYFKKNIEQGGDLACYKHLADFYVRSNQYEKAIETVNEGIRVCGKTGEGYFYLYGLYSDLCKYDEALMCAEHMRKYADTDIIYRQYYFCMGSAYMGKENYHKALECFEQAEKEDCPAVSTANQAICLQGLGRYEDAIIMYQKSAYLQKEISIIHLCMMQHCRYFIDGKADYKLAEQILAESIRQMNNNMDRKKEFLCVMGEAYASMESFSQSEACFEQAEKERLSPSGEGECDFLWARAWFCLYQGKTKEALGYFEQAMETGENRNIILVEYKQVKQWREGGSCDSRN